MHSKVSTQPSEFSNFLWVQIYKELKRKIDPTTFNSWFRNLQFLGIDKTTLEISVASKFIKEWITNNYLDTIIKTARCFKPEITNINIKVQATKRSKKKAETTAEVQAYTNKTYYDNIGSKLNPAFTLANFVVGDYNKIAYKSAQQLLAPTPHISGNSSLYIQSKVGMGKTHLMQAFSHQLNENSDKPKAIYFSAEKFINQYVYAYRQNQLTEFRNHINKHDVFLIDDIQFICGKISTQQELIKCITYFIEHNKKVIISGDCSPFGLSMDKRFISRLTGGMVVQILEPDYATRLKIVKHKLKVMQEEIDSTIAEFIAENITNSIRELEGALFKIISHKNILEENITLTRARKILEENVSANKKSISFDLIITEVAKYFGISMDEIISKSRLKKFVYPRQLVALLAKQLTRDSLQELGDKLGGRDHATIIYSITRTEEKAQIDSAVKNDISTLMKLICN